MKRTQNKPSLKNNSYGFSSKNGIRVRKEMEKSMGYFLTAPNPPSSSGSRYRLYKGRGPNATAESGTTPPLLSKSSTTALVFLILLLISPPLHAHPLESFLIFYSNNIQGELEPCG
jgi:hypothetical protein